MEILQVVAVGFVATTLLVIIRQQRPELAVLLSIAVGTLIFLFVLGQLATVLRALEELAARAGLDRFYLTTVLKIIGVAYLAEFGAQVCRDAGEGAVAAKVELAGKVLILVLAVPVIVAVLEFMLRLLP